jgi:serine protease Do
MNSTLKTALIALGTSIGTLGAYKFIENQNKDVVFNEAASNSSFGKLTNFIGGQPGDFTSAAAVSAPTVVHIKAKSITQRQSRQNSIFDFFGYDEDFFGGGQRQQESSGSGVIITNDGYIVTNNHVVEGAQELEVITYNKKIYEATIIGTDPSTDIAVIKIEESKLPAITFSNSDDVKIGEWVLAVGNPFNLENTVTAGIVSAIGRSIDILSQKRNGQRVSDAPIESFIQTDAAVNPGNSGGALVNLQGHLIGINTAIASPNGAYAGYSFAVPSSIVKKVSSDLIKFGNVQRGYIGIAPVELNSKKAKEFDVNLDEGIYCESVPEDGSAHNAGIRKGDVITKVDGIETRSEPKFRELIGRKRPGEKVTMTVNRKGSVKDYVVTLKNKTGGEGIVKPESSFGKLGVSLSELSDSKKEEIGIRNGVKIDEIQSGSYLAQNTDIEPGFIITRIGNTRVNSIKDVKAAIASIEKGGEEEMILCGIYPESPRRTYCTSIWMK